MILLTGESLGKRQHELNSKVLETVKNQINFDEVEALEEKSDIDKFYKIDVASHYRNIDFFVEILKCGDALYISRVLKCGWLYDKEYSHIINPDYLHHEIFPLMSFKMKTKMINSIAANIRDEDRAETFFEYCNELKMVSFSKKFLIFVSEKYKLSIIEDNVGLITSEILENFIGNSFELATKYISKIPAHERTSCLNKLSYLYKVDEEQFLDLFEAYTDPKSSCSFGGRMSKSIMTKHKSRVLAAPLLYINSLHKYTVTRHATSGDSKKFIIALFPAKVEEFWSQNFYGTFQYIFKKISRNEVLSFFKNTFRSFYGTDEPFEMTITFFNFKYYELFNIEEREQWALKHIEESKELLGVKQDFKWYEFVNFDIAFKSIKDYILLTRDNEMRNNMMKTLVTSCKNQKQLETLFNYFYEKHLNDVCHNKEDFVYEVVTKHNVFEFEESCWNAFDKILYSFEVYTPGFYGQFIFRACCIIYNILHGKEIHDVLKFYMDSDGGFNFFEMFSKQLSSDQWTQVYQYLYDYYHKNFQTVNEKKKRITIVNIFISLLRSFDKPREDLPTIMVAFIEENPDDFKNLNREIQLQEAYFLRLLKKDKTLVLDSLPEMRNAINGYYYGFNIRRFIKKIRIYFSNDLSIEYFKFFDDYIANIKNYPWDGIHHAVYGILQLDDENNKAHFLNKYVPKAEKIDYQKLDRKELAIQEAICRFAGYARPPLPLPIVLQYLKGDYVHYCMPIFKIYLANLPQPLCNKFIESILDNPLSIQKHGIRLAFKVYSNKNLKNLITNIWKNTKNVPLRFYIYKALHNKIKEATELSQAELFETLKTFTLTLNGDDDDEIFDLLGRSYDIPEKYRSDLLKAAWRAVKDLSHKKTINIIIKIKVVDAIARFSIGDREFLRSEIITEHIENMLCNKQILHDFKDKEKDLHNSVWDIACMYIISSRNENELKNSLEVLHVILHEIFKNWNLFVNNNKAYVQFFYDFLHKLNHGCNTNNYPFIVPVFEKVLVRIEEYSPNHEMFLLILDIKLFIAMRKIGNKDEKDILLLAKEASASLFTYTQELKANNLIMPYFYNDIVSLISKSVTNLGILNNLTPEIFTAYTCIEILKTDDIDLITFAISIMPIQSPPCNKESFKNLSLLFTEKVKQINNCHVQSYLYKKFYLSGALGVY